jgi:hypothetical protein
VFAVRIAEKTQLPTDVTTALDTTAEPAGARRLVLITCGGPLLHYSWGNTYRDNVLVYATPRGVRRRYSIGDRGDGGDLSRPVYVYSEGGSGNRAVAQYVCKNSNPTQWRSYVEAAVNSVGGSVVTPATFTSAAVSLNCGV